MPFQVAAPTSAPMIPYSEMSDAAKVAADIQPEQDLMLLVAPLSPRRKNELSSGLFSCRVRPNRTMRT